jgi:hypothetical protein
VIRKGREGSNPASATKMCVIWLYGATGRRNGLKIHTVWVRIPIESQKMLYYGSWKNEN